MKKYSLCQLSLFGLLIVCSSLIYADSHTTPAFPKTNRIIGTDFSEQRLNYLQGFQEEAFCMIPA